MADHVWLGDVRTWYDERGTAGEPVVLLHGGMTDSRSFEGMTEEFAERYRVFLPDRRGHGRTADVEGPVTYELMARDTIAFLETVVGGPAHLVGYSDGGTVALQVAFLRPDLVRRAVVISGVFNHGGNVAGILPEDPEASGELPEFLVSAYGEVSPDGVEHLPVVTAKVMRMASEGPTLQPGDLAGVPVPVLAMVADDDIVTLEHTVAMYRGLPNAELAVIPGASHALIFEKRELCTRIALDFLAGTSAPPMMSVSRQERSH